MSFVCPECSFTGSLCITSKIELPPDYRSDEITLQVIACSNCGFAGLAVYEESRRGSFDSDSFQHTGYHVNVGNVKAVRDKINTCPMPANRKCGCSAHRELGKQDNSGRWIGLGNMLMERSFVMRIVR